MSRVAIGEAVLQWAVDRSGISYAALRGKFPKIHLWESGEIQPTLRQLESLARATSTPIGFFFLKTPPELQMPIPYFRSVTDESPYKPSADLLDTILMLQRRQTWMREFLIEEGEEKLPFVKCANIKESPIEIANIIRNELKIKSDWASKQSTWTDALRVLRDAMESAGIIVTINGVVGNNTQRKLDPNEFRGFVLNDEFAPFVFVNGADGKAAQMFTLAHELAHVFVGSSAAFDLRELKPANDPTEQSCNQVAAEFLVPEQELLRAWNSIKHDKDPFQATARQFKVSVLVSARRLLDLKLITNEYFYEFYNAYLEDERRFNSKKQSGGDFYATQNSRVSRRFGDTIIRATKEGKLLYSEAYRLTGLYGKTFERFSDSLNLGSL